MTRLEELPHRIDDLTSQISQLRTEMRGEFSAVRAEIAGQGDTNITTLRGEMVAQGAALETKIDALGTHMRVLHEDVVSRIARLQEGRPTPRKRKPRKG